MNTHTAGGAVNAMKRWFSGSSLFITDYTFEGHDGYGRIAFSEVKLFFYNCRCLLPK